MKKPAFLPSKLTQAGVKGWPYARLKTWQIFPLQLLLALAVFQWAGRTPLTQPLAGYNDQLMTGFYGVESNPAFSYRWTQKTASLELPQSAWQDQLTLWLSAPRPAANTKVSVEVLINARSVAQLELDPTQATPRPYTVSWQSLTAFPTARLELKVANPFYPVGDNRELGVIVSALGVQGQSGPLGVYWPTEFAGLYILGVTGLLNWLFRFQFLRLLWPAGDADQRLPLVRTLGLIILPTLIVFEPLLALIVDLMVLAGFIVWQRAKKWLISPVDLDHTSDATDDPVIKPKAKVWYRERDSHVAIALFSVALVVYSFTAPNALSSPNAGSHFALVRAITERLSFEISPFLDYTMRTDYASPAPRLYFTDRPPGLAWLAAPLVGWGRLAASSSLLAPLFPALELFKQPVSLVWYALDWAMLIPALSGAVAVALLFKTARLEVFGGSFKGALIAALYFGFATIAWKYSTTFYSHAPAMALVLAGVYLSLRSVDNTQPGSKTRFWYPSLAAFVLGFSVCVDYTNLLLILALLVYLGFRWRRRLWPGLLKERFGFWMRAGWLSVLALSSLIALAVYQAVCFGSPLSTSYTYSAKWAWARSLATTFDRAPWEGLGPLFLGWGHLAQIYDDGNMRGLFLLSPGLLLALWGFYYLGQHNRASLVLLLGLIVPLTLLMSAHHTYWGGGDFDARYLLVTLPYWCLPLAQWWDRWASRSGRAGWRLVLGVIVFYSLLANFLHLLVDYPRRLLQWAGTVSVAPIVPPGAALPMHEPAYMVFQTQQALLALIIGLGVLILAGRAFFLERYNPSIK